MRPLITIVAIYLGILAIATVAELITYPSWWLWLLLAIGWPFTLGGLVIIWRKIEVPE